MATHKYRLLVVDDNPAIHEDFRKILTRAEPEHDSYQAARADFFESDVSAAPLAGSFEIQSAFQGQEALTLVQAAHAEGRPYALAFVDVRMPPGWDGVETISHLWQVNPELQVVVCTAYADYSWEEITRRVGDSDSLVILKKPFDNIEVQQLANALTKKWRLTQESKNRLQDLNERVRERTMELENANRQLQEQVAERTRAEERFAKSFQASPIPIAIQCLASGVFVDGNQSFLAMTGYDRKKVVGCTPGSLDLVVEDDTYASMAEQFRQGKPVRNRELQIRTKSGELKTVLAFGEVLELAASPHVLLMLHDVTERLSLESQLRQAQKMEAVGQLAAGVAHDFNNLLTIIQGHASLRLGSGKLEAKTDHSLRLVLSAAERGANLTRQLLAFSRKQTMQRKPLHLNQLISQSLAMLRRMIGEHIDLQCHFGEPLPYVFADRGNLEQVLMNLCVNARDAMPEGGELTIATAAVDIGKDYLRVNPEASVGKHVRLTVMDTGCGMDATTQARVFEPFFTTKEVGKGTGMGLATVHGIVKQHNGWIELQSRLGQGTAFKIFLSAHASGKAGEEELSTPALLSVPGGRETILVVEDEEYVRDFVRMVLESHGYRVVVAGDGMEALQLWHDLAEEVKLVITDMVMPKGITGHQLAERLKAQKPHLKVIYTSGYSLDVLGSDFRLPEGLAFLQKPYPSNVLAQTVRTCLDREAAEPGPTRAETEVPLVLN